MGKLFGTDGVRGIPGKHPLTRDLIKAIAFVAAGKLRARGYASGNGSVPRILLGRDTRSSGPALGRYLVEGFRLAGCKTVDLGVIPTPALSYLAPRVHALCGVMISASHNPAEFNGIKFFTGDGYKMSSEIENEVEAAVFSGPRFPSPSPGFGSSIGAREGSSMTARYVDFLKSTFPATLDLSGFKVVVDCGNGSASKIAPALIESLGARVFPLACSPNGRNINARSGALYPEAMQKAVVKHGAQCGVSFDGDADRAIFSDERGCLLDGDALICLSALRLKSLGLLRQDKVVLTVMSNFGLRQFLEKQDISVVSVPVGDRHVTDAIEKEGLSIGGEASGHIVYRSFAATGDGMLTALQTLAALAESALPLSSHRKAYRATPQIIKNLKVLEKTPLEKLPRLTRLIKTCEKRLKDSGRIFIRYSGTEPLLRIMVEGPDAGLVRRMAGDLSKVYLEETGQISKGRI